MHYPAHNADLDLVVDLMRNLSRLKDPQQAANLYGRGLDRLNLVPCDRYLSISRRDLASPHFRITRNTDWTEHPNPWKEKHKLPILSGGILADILYSNEPAIITDLAARATTDDPAFASLEGMNLLVALPHYDNGESINYGILLSKSEDGFPFKDVPMMIWQANLWGRATLNLVNQQRLQEAHDAMDRELQVVGDIQRSLLPRALPKIPGLEVAAHYHTSQRAGGDYYDFFPLPNDQWGILLADVSGHGTPAAVLMAITHAIAHARPGNPIPPEDLLSFVNSHLAKLYTNNNGNFVTAIYAVYDSKNRTLTYASAGHPPPRLIRTEKSQSPTSNLQSQTGDGDAQSQISNLKSPISHSRIISLEGESSLPLGIYHNEPFQSHTLQLQPGDRLLFYTDGITEAFNPEGDLFGTARLDNACLAKNYANPASLINELLACLADFTQNEPITDDRTLLAMSIT